MYNRQRTPFRKEEKCIEKDFLPKVAEYFFFFPFLPPPSYFAPSTTKYDDAQFLYTDISGSLGAYVTMAFVFSLEGCVVHSASAYAKQVLWLAVTTIFRGQKEVIRSACCVYPFFVWSVNLHVYYVNYPTTQCHETSLPMVFASGDWRKSHLLLVGF